MPFGEKESTFSLHRLKLPIKHQPCLSAPYRLKQYNAAIDNACTPVSVVGWATGAPAEPHSDMMMSFTACSTRTQLGFIRNCILCVSRMGTSTCHHHTIKRTRHATDDALEPNQGVCRDKDRIDCQSRHASMTATARDRYRRGICNRHQRPSCNSYISCTTIVDVLA